MTEELQNHCYIVLLYSFSDINVWQIIRQMSVSTSTNWNCYRHPVDSSLIQHCVTSMIFLGSMDQASFIDLTNWNFSMQRFCRRDPALYRVTSARLYRLSRLWLSIFFRCTAKREWDELDDIYHGFCPSIDFYFVYEKVINFRKQYYDNKLLFNLCWPLSIIPLICANIEC